MAEIQVSQELKNLLVNQGYVPTHQQIQGHALSCKICNLPRDLKWTVDSMILEGKSSREIIMAMQEEEVFLTEANISGHKRYFQYVCSDEMLQDLFNQIHSDEKLKKELMSETETYLAKQYEQIQSAKNRELLMIWNRTLPAIRYLLDRAQENPMFPVKDYADAYERLAKTALLFEGKPTGRLYVEQHGNIANGKIEIDGLNTLCKMVGVELVDEDI